MADFFGFERNQPLTRHNIPYAELGITAISIREANDGFQLGKPLPP
jgi:hypothetical protein